MNTLHTEKHPLPNGSVLQMSIHYDEDCATPRDHDNLGTLLIHPAKAHWVSTQQGDIVIDLDIPMGDNPRTHLRNLLSKQLGLTLNDVFAYPITLYESGEVNLSLGDKKGWDYAVCGYIVVEKEKIRNEYGTRYISKNIRKRVEACLQGELSLLADWINGYVYGYTIDKVTYDNAHNETNREQLASTWGYIGDERSCQADAETELRSILTAGI